MVKRTLSPPVSSPVSSLSAHANHVSDEAFRRHQIACPRVLGDEGGLVRQYAAGLTRPMRTADGDASEQQGHHTHTVHIRDAGGGVTNTTGGPRQFWGRAFCAERAGPVVNWGEGGQASRYYVNTPPRDHRGRESVCACACGGLMSRDVVRRAIRAQVIHTP